MLRKFLRNFITLLAALLLVPTTQPLANPATEKLRLRIEQLQEQGTLEIDGARVAAVNLIGEIYARREFALAWKSASIASLFRVLSTIERDGLNPEDYHLSALRKLATEFAPGSVPDPGRRIDYDILLTDSLIRLGYHLRFGKVDPYGLDSNWNFKRELLDDADPASVIQAAIDVPSLSEFIEEKISRGAFYNRLRDTLDHYKKIAVEGGWPMVADGETLKPGARDARIKTLRARLQTGGDWQGTEPADAELYDETLVSAVKSFQARHGLIVDGLVGKSTLAAINVPIESRIDQIRVNLERARWVFDDIEDNFLIVNIAGFRVYLVRNREVIWSSRVVVGKRYRKTPVFKSQMKYLVFNPTWTVPPGILRKDILPKVREDPSYLKTKGLDVVDGKGRIVDPTTIDWANISAKGFPYQLVQPPSANNALGQVKFIFPNAHMVFLHDTPSKNLFDQSERTFSSGCIRVENPLQLAELLLNDQTKWNNQAIQNVLASKETQTVFLPTPLTVMLLYWTVEVDDEGVVRFHQDVYDRDARILEGLNGEFVFAPPNGLQPGS